MNLLEHIRSLRTAEGFGTLLPMSGSDPLAIGTEIPDVAGMAILEEEVHRAITEAQDADLLAAWRAVESEEDGSEAGLLLSEIDRRRLEH